MMEKDYPYKMEDSYCVYDREMRQKTGATVKGVVKVRPGDEEALKDAIATKGPVTIAYDASHDNMSFYSRCVVRSCARVCVLGREGGGGGGVFFFFLGGGEGAR